MKKSNELNLQNLESKNLFCHHKGFTLIELLAVIVIIAIIAVIAVPIIKGIMEDARREAFTRSVEFAMSQYDFLRQSSGDAYFSTKKSLL